MNPRVLSTLFFLSLCLAASPALANDSAPRYSLGLSTGFGHPMGLLQGGDGHQDEPLKDRVSGIIPAQLDLGLFLTSRVYLGISFQYAHILLASGYSPQIGDALGLRLGATLSYHLPASDRLSPWFGLGTGYELLRPFAHSFNGLEFFNVQAGADLHAGGPIWLGPFVTFAVGQYVNVNDRQQHYWLMGGLRLSMRQTPEKDFPAETPQAEIIASSGDSMRGLGSRATRIPAGILAGTLAGSLGAIPGTFLMFQRYCFDCSNNSVYIYTGLALAVGGMIGGSALGIDSLGGTLGGHGSFWATSVGTLLGTLVGIIAGAALAPTAGAAVIIPGILAPAVGGVIAYEISHSIAVEEAAAATASRPRFVPLVSASPRGGVIGGLAGRF